jgi:PilZ domain-containing protein
MDERRTKPRMRMLKSGKIFLGSRGVPCTVRSLSETGACLQVQTTYGIPSLFELAIADGDRRTCKVVWLDSTRLGVQYQ